MSETSSISVTMLPRVEASARGRSVAIGEAEGFKARELFLMAIGSCFMQNLRAAIEARNLAITNIALEVVGTIENRRIISAELIISADYSNRDELEHVVMITERGCLISNTVRSAVELSYTIRDAEAV